MNATSSAWLRRLPLVCAVGLGLVMIATTLQPFEDSFISYRYAENWASGLGLRFNPGETVEGYSSFLWVLILAGAALAGAHLDIFATLLSVASAVAILLLTYRAARDLAGLSPVAAAGAVFVVSMTTTWSYYAGTGMETTTHALLVLSAWLAASLPATPQRTRWIGLFIGLALLSRPEAGGYAVALALALALGNRFRDALKVTAIASSIFGPYLLWRIIHFGHLLPNPFYAKADPSIQLWLHGLGYVEAFLTSQGFWVAAAGALMLWRRRGMQPWLQMSVAVSLAAIVTSMLGGGDTFARYRFLLPAVPIWSILAVAGAVEFATRLPPSKRAWMLAPALALWSVLLFGGPRGVCQSYYAKGRTDELRQIADLRYFSDDYTELGQFLRQQLPPDTWLATNAAGIIPYYSRLPTIDMLGLNDAHIAHRDIELGHGAAGHEKHDGAYVLSRRPGIILLGLPRRLRRAPASADELRAYVTRLTRFLPGDREIVSHPDFAAHYVPLLAAPGDDGLFLLFVRRDLQSYLRRR